MLFLLMPLALADEQTLVYDLTINGQSVGTRTLSVQYLPTDRGGERRVLTSLTTASVGPEKWTIRTTSLSGGRSASFTSSVDHNGALYQVQGKALSTGGWSLNLTDKKGFREWEVAASEAKISSVDVMDPGRSMLLAEPGVAGMVMVETGDVVLGRLEGSSTATIKVGGQPVTVTRYTVNNPDGKAIFDYDASGLLLRQELQWLGGTVVATAKSVPPPRSFGDIELGPTQTIDEKPL